MAWKYSQTTGEFRKADGTLLATGFAGRNVDDQKGLNNPLLQGVKSIGPLPRGFYDMVAWHQQHPSVGAMAIELKPQPGTDMLGRNSFLIHGLSMMNPLASSHGCIILGTGDTRLSIWRSGDRVLEVVE